MPELPEVELHRRHLDAWLPGRTVARVEAGARLVMHQDQPFEALAAALEGRRLGPVKRHGKHLFCTVASGGALYVHLGMTGHLSRRAEGAAEPRFRALSLVLDTGLRVELTDPRRFGAVGFFPRGMEDPEAPHAGMGPDLLFNPPTPEALCAFYARVSSPLKVALMDQARVAGLGNIHVAEALWRARISPRQRARDLTLPQAHALLTGIRETFDLVLGDDDGEGVAYVEVPGNANPFLVYDREGEPCPRCRTALMREVQGGRSTFFCPTCQPPPDAAAAAPAARASSGPGRRRRG